MKFDDYEKTYIGVYAEFAAFVRTLLKNAIAETEGLPRLQSTKSRAKAAESLKAKLEGRDILASDRIENEIKDLAGVRLIFYTETDVDRFLSSRLVPELLEVDVKETKVHHPTGGNDPRYKAFHYVVSLGKKQEALPEYEKFKGMRCEIQIQTVLNHAWAETYHDMIYKARDGDGFGSNAREALDKRMKKVMDDHLRPAGYEFQKCQHDHERLMEGKALFDRGALDAMEKCDNNNDRHEILSTLSEHVIPNYDDIPGIYPDICRALEAAVHAARNTETKPIESVFGNLRGKTPKDVTLLAIGIFSDLRYVDTEATLRSLISIYKDEKDKDVRKEIIDAVKRLASYDLHVWKQAGPYVQGVLADTLEKFSNEELASLRPIILTIWRELLGSDMEGSTFSADKVTISMGAVPANEAVKNIREKAINGVISLLDNASSPAEKMEAVSALREATRLPHQATYSNDLCKLALEDTKKITEFLTQRAGDLPYEILERIEHDMLFDYQRACQIADDEQDKFSCRETAESVIETILAFRDLVNADAKYVRYKTLVGFQGVFPQHWEDENFHFGEVEKYRMQQVALFIDDISDETADDWHTLIQRCAATKSNDMATFPVFGEFMRQLSKTKPAFALTLVERNDQEVMTFLPAILTGLFESEVQDKYAELVKGYLNRGLHLTAIVRHCRAVKTGAVADTVKKVLAKSIPADEIIAIFECMVFAIEHHDAAALPLIEDVFIPAMTYAVDKKDARWVRGAYFLREGEQFFKELPPAAIDLILENLLTLAKLDFEAERILTIIAANKLAAVWQFLEGRLQEDRDKEEHYEAIPYQFYGLEKQLGKNSDLAIATLRKWYKPGDDMFRFTGGRLLHAIFPSFTDELAGSLNQLIARGSSEDYDFVINLLENYRGETTTHEVVKQLIDRLPEDDRRLNRLDLCLSNTGVVGGEFGMVEAYQSKKAEISSWLEDTRPKVKKFAAEYIRRLDQRIASEQRSAEMRKELRKRDYDGEDEDE